MAAVVSGSADGTVCIWKLATGLSGASSILSDHALLQDEIYVHHHPEHFRISPPLLLTETPSLDLYSPWIVHSGSGLQCWLPPQYRNVEITTSHTTLICIALKSGQVLAVSFCCSDPPNAVLN